VPLRHLPPQDHQQLMEFFNPLEGRNISETLTKKRKRDEITHFYEYVTIHFKFESEAYRQACQGEWMRIVQDRRRSCRRILNCAKRIEN